MEGYLTEQEIQDYWDKEEQIKKAEEEVRLLAMTKPEDAEHVVLKRQHAEKVRKSVELKKHKYDSYMWTVNSRLKPEPITDIKIQPKTKPVVITVYEVVKDLMDSLSQRYERLKKIPEELRIHFDLPAPAPEQASSRSSGKKRKHMELKPETRIPGLECNRALLENVSFDNNMVIKKLEYGTFFTDEFRDQAFQRWSDIDKVGMEALVSYLVAASMVKSTENARFSMKLRKLIAKHPNQEKLKSKKVKLEALGYKMD
ncbi:hypothetical protein Tco_0719867 [Tanacetum coccineum]